MDIAQTVNYSRYSVSAHNTTKSVSQVEKSEEVKELSEKEELAEFKKEIWKEIDSLPWNRNINTSIQITDSAFKRMMKDDDFKDRMMDVMRRASIAGRPPITACLTWIDENGYKGYSYLDADAGKLAYGEHSKHKDSFFVKKASHKQDYMELWEERRYEREVQREKLDTEYEKQLYLKQHWARKERAAAAYESNIMEAALQE